MPFIVALAVRELRMTPPEALWSATAGGARALRRDDVGHLGVGARADLAYSTRPHSYTRPTAPGCRWCVTCSRTDAVADREFAPWSGRGGSPEPEHARWHSVVRGWAPGSRCPRGPSCWSGSPRTGSPTRNGAVWGPPRAPRARQALASLSDPGCPVFDAGDVVVATATSRAGRRASVRSSPRCSTPATCRWCSVAAVPSPMGRTSAGPDARVGVLNVDAHFDLRGRPRHVGHPVRADGRRRGVRGP